MSNKTKINWTDSTWNPVTGCTPAGAGCAHCYAKRVAERFPVTHGGVEKWEGFDVSSPFSRVILHPVRLDIPRHWKKPRVIMCPSMGDLLHEDVPSAFVDEVWKVWRDCQQHTFIVLTKRPERMREYLREPPVLRNVVLGVSVSTQAEADRWIPLLLDTPAHRRIVSLEPLVGPVKIDFGGFCDHKACMDYSPHPCDNPRCESRFISGVIVGGESGPGARPMHPDWVRSLRDQCAAGRAPFFFKQWGPRNAGRVLDGVEHNDLCWEVSK